MQEVVETFHLGPPTSFEDTEFEQGWDETPIQ